MCVEPATGDTKAWEDYIRSLLVKSQFGREMLAMQPDLFDHILWDWWNFGEGRSDQGQDSTVGKAYYIHLPESVRDEFRSAGTLLANTMNVYFVAHEVFHAFQRTVEPERNKVFTTIQMEREATMAGYVIRKQATGDEIDPQFTKGIRAGTSEARDKLVAAGGLSSIAYFFAPNGEKQSGNLEKAFTVDLNFSLQSIADLFRPHHQLLPVVQLGY